MRRIEQLAAMYAHITGDTEADALRKIKETDAGRAIARESEIYLYNQPTHNLTEIARELKDENLRNKFTESAIDEAFLAVKGRENAEKRRYADKDRFFENLSSDTLETDEEDEAEEDETDEEENDGEDESQ